MPSAKARGNGSSGRRRIEDEEEKLLIRAKLAEETERYKDMAHAMASLARSRGQLTAHERSMLSAAFKNHVGAMRASWRILRASMEEEAVDKKRRLMQRYLRIMEGELREACTSILQLLVHRVLPSTDRSDVECIVFYRKMVGDYERYMAEVMSGEDGFEATRRARDAYDEALAAAAALAPTHPTRLGLALNYAVFQFEVLNSPSRACAVAKAAVDAAIDHLDSLSEEHYRDATLVLQLLRDNISMWVSAVLSPDSAPAVTPTGSAGSDAADG